MEGDEGGEKEHWYQVALIVKDSDFPYKRYLTANESKIRSAMGTIFKGYYEETDGRIECIRNECKVSFIRGRVTSLEIVANKGENIKDCFEFLGFKIPGPRPSEAQL